MIDCVGYIGPSSLGYIEGDQPRMVRTPWYESEIPFNMAAEIGTQKVINEHSTIGLVVTTDGSISDIPREEYEEAEERVIEELKEIKHHLIDVCDGNDSFSVSDYEKQALVVINDLQNKGKIPIVVGGTGFYINSLLYGLSYGNSAKNQEIRDKYNKMAEEFGVEKVFEKLKETKKLFPYP